MWIEILIAEVVSVLLTIYVFIPYAQRNWENKKPSKKSGPSFRQKQDEALKKRGFFK